jgi:hypothetical protein
MKGKWSWMVVQVGTYIFGRKAVVYLKYAHRLALVESFYWQKIVPGA